jgi:hypothetical protein
MSNRWALLMEFNCATTSRSRINLASLLHISVKNSWRHEDPRELRHPWHAFERRTLTPELSTVRVLSPDLLHSHRRVQFSKKLPQNEHGKTDYEAPLQGPLLGFPPTVSPYPLTMKHR